MCRVEMEIGNSLERDLLCSHKVLSGFLYIVSSVLTAVIQNPNIFVQQSAHPNQVQVDSDGYEERHCHRRSYSNSKGGRQQTT